MFHISLRDLEISCSIKPFYKTRGKCSSAYACWLQQNLYKKPCNSISHSNHRHGLSAWASFKIQHRASCYMIRLPFVEALWDTRDTIWNSHYHSRSAFSDSFGRKSYRADGERSQAPSSCIACPEETCWYRYALVIYLTRSWKSQSVLRKWCSVYTKVFSAMQAHTSRPHSKGASMKLLSRRLICRRTIQSCSSVSSFGYTPEVSLNSPRKPKRRLPSINSADFTSSVMLGSWRVYRMPLLTS